MSKTITPTEITKERAEELGRCVDSYTYFINRYCKIYDSVDKQWIPFTLWDAQRQVLKDVHNNKLTVILKARQLGISWLSLSYALWTMMFEPIAVISIFSRREEEASYLMGSERLRGIYNNLPPWMKTGYESVTDSVLEWKMANKSVCRAFSTKSGDGYVATLAIVDEADLSPDLNTLMRSVKPTIVNGGKMIMLSRVNKSEPESEFKNTYRAAKAGENGWKSVFLPWYAHPGRDEAWYENERKDIVSRTGSLDELHEQYPATDTEALSAKSLEKRIPPMWIEMVTQEQRPSWVRGSPTLQDLDIYKAPVPGARYVIGVDSAEGNPNSDESCLCVVDVNLGEQVALLACRVEPSIFAGYVSQVSAYYNNAAAMVERNNHGHSVIQWLEEHARRVKLLLGHDAETHKKKTRDKKRRKHMKAGWLSSTLGKTILYNVCAEHIRQCAKVDVDGEDSIKVIHDASTSAQLSDIESATLRAPDKRHDDRADAFALAQVGRKQILDSGAVSMVLVDSMKG